MSLQELLYFLSAQKITQHHKFFNKLTILRIHIPEVSNMMRRCWTTRRSVIYSVRVKVPSSRQTIICSILGYQLSCQILRCFLILQVRICILYQHGYYAGSIMFTIIILVQLTSCNGRHVDMEAMFSVSYFSIQNVNSNLLTFPRSGIKCYFTWK